MIAGHVVGLQDEVIHLGHFLDSGADVRRKSAEFIRLANSTRIHFLGCNPDVVTRLIRSYSIAFHGTATWS